MVVNTEQLLYFDNDDVSASLLLNTTRNSQVEERYSDIIRNTFRSRPLPAFTCGIIATNSKAHSKVSLVCDIITAAERKQH